MGRVESPGALLMGKILLKLRVFCVRAELLGGPTDGGESLQSIDE